MDHAQKISANLLIRIIEDLVDELESFKELINRLNVYPVPDGDTGTNLFLTIVSVKQEIESTPGANEDLNACIKAISRGALMGARGNSGVIFSQIIRGFVEGIGQAFESGMSTIDGVLIGLTKASDLADKAVLRPVEGTILTVARDTARIGRSFGSNPSAAVISELRDVAINALVNTPNQLPILKEANVVDAGGAGFVVFMNVIAKTLDKGYVQKPSPWFEVSSVDVGGVELLASNSNSDSGFKDISALKYEVMFLLESTDSAVEGFREVWAGIGDSIVVVGQDGIWNCHIHTDDVGAAIEAAIEAGHPKNIRVTDLSEQVSEENWVLNAHGSGAPDPLGVSDEHSVTAVIAVANGGGVGRIFRSMGVNRIVLGGQSMNPSTADLLAAMEGLAAAQIIVLPNNSNIIPVAEMAAQSSEKEVRVLPTRGVVEGFAALMEFDPAANLEENYQSMLESVGRVTTGEITQAVRNSKWNRGIISKGDYLGISGDGIVAVETSPIEAIKKLLSKLITSDSEIVTLIAGEGSSSAITRDVTEWINESWPNLEVEIHHGDQPLYPYLLGVE